MTNEVCSGQVQADPGFSHWLLEFDGVFGNKELLDPQGYGAIEYGYTLIAQPPASLDAPSIARGFPVIPFPRSE
ncbi:hypothetical protein [Luteimonas terrae]|uniref:Uncharacterized protein n=1 Tax=Luteimonas terrae TaxID=1530191 RepID=A0ABU1XZ04_9GAMM|nr:hypothetical protein [Luteimonas terrae]MDR7193296.1 hypothetical protein [Luteimonas terrae]